MGNQLRLVLVGQVAGESFALFAAMLGHCCIVLGQEVNSRDLIQQAAPARAVDHPRNICLPKQPTFHLAVVLWQ
jgi:hypothetical protein